MTENTYPYPKADRIESGSKVCWRHYTDQTDADRAAEIARKEARDMERRGYDFGFCQPGSISTTSGGLFRVCCP